MEKALAFLATTDEKAAELKTQSLRMEYVVDLARKRIFLTENGSIEQRKALAETHPDVQEAIGNYLDSVEEYEKVKARRVTAELLIEVWRTTSANMRRGNL
jgi:hypothetical protein